MVVPEKYMKVLSIFQRAVKTGELSEINKIPLEDLKMAKHRLVSDKDSPYYSLLLDTIKERDALETTKRKITAINKYKSHTNFSKNRDIFLAHRFAEDELIEELKKDIKKAGYNWKEGKREDLGSISEDIQSKIESCGFFVAVMTRKNQLKSGRYTTSSWLIEEKELH
ncbi:hypothetical protein ES703_33095 [subsurface metagenome]